MAKNAMAGKVQTVTGLVDPGELGFTSIHEHLFHDSTGTYFHEHPGAPEMADVPVGYANRWWVENNPCNNRDNLIFKEDDIVAAEVERFVDAGGGTIVELSVTGMHSKPEAIRALSEATGAKIVKGAGYYIQASHPGSVASQSVEELAAVLIGEVTVGIEGTTVRAGILGELGVSNPFHPDEEKVLRAAVLTHQETGVPISIHPGMADEVLLKIVDVLLDAGASPEHVILGHLDCFGFSRETRLKVADAGFYLAFDNFGHTRIMPTQMLGKDLLHPSDGVRLDDLRFFIDAGYGERILVGHDLFWKHDMASYGGHGLSHFQRNIVPIMRNIGFDEAEIAAVTRLNPAKVLTFAAT